MITYRFVTVKPSPYVGNLPCLPQVLILRTCVIRNAVPIRFLSAGVGTVFRIRSFRGECRITDRAHHVFAVEISLVFLQFIVAEIAAGVVAAVFLDLDGGVKLLSAPETDDLAYR